MRVDEFIHLFTEAVNGNNMEIIDNFNTYIDYNVEDFVRNCTEALSTSIGPQITVIFSKIGVKHYRKCSQEQKAALVEAALQ